MKSANQPQTSILFSCGSIPDQTVSHEKGDESTTAYLKRLADSADDRAIEVLANENSTIAGACATAAAVFRAASLLSERMDDLEAVLIDVSINTEG